MGNILTRKLYAGFAVLMLVMSVFSGAISAADMDTNSDTLPIAEGSNARNMRFGEGAYVKAAPGTKTDNGITVLSPEDGVALKNQTKKVHVAISNASARGKFTMGGYYNEQWQTLLYGYPRNGSTSYLTIRVENATASVNYTNKGTMMDPYVVEPVHWIGEDAVSMKWRLPDDIVIEQNIRLVQDFARIEIDATNEGSSTKKIGVRYYYDTMVARSDKAPIYIPGVGVKTTEEEYVNPTFTYWKGYDHPTEPTVVSEAKISGDDATPPDKLQIDNYNSYSKPWDNYVTPGSSFSDSAVLTYWNPSDVAPGQSRQVVTYYGIGEPVTRGPFNISEILVDRVDGNYCPEETVTIKVDVISIGETHEGSVKIEILDDGDVLHSSPLKPTELVPADGAKTVEFNWTVDVEACGKSLDIKASLLNSSTQSLIDERTKSSLITVDPGCPGCAIKPDLTVTNITWAPADIVGGDTVTFTAAVENIGAGNTASDFSVQFKIDGNYIGDAKVSGGLDSGSSIDVTQTWTATWANTVNVSVDEYNAVEESDETNNTMSTNLPGIPFPDLTVSQLTWEPKENVSAGDDITFTATIENIGGAFYSTMSNPLKVAFLVNDEYVGSRNIVGGIRVGQPLNTTFTWIAQSGTNPTICVKADYSNIIPESNETNNELCETLSLVIKSPDLTITHLTFEPTGSLHVGDTVKFTAKVENIGEGDYNGDFDVGFSVNNASVGTSQVINGVAAGESVFSSFNWTASSSSNPVIKANADFFDVVQESAEDNNEKTETLIASIPYADLEITGINWTPIENIKDRDPVTFDVTVKNNGPENVVTDFKVQFDIDGYFTRTNVISGGLAAGESTTTSYTWKATPGDDHNATVKVDPENVVPESDETNNNRIQLLSFTVSLVEIFEVKVEPAEITTGIGGQTSCKLNINNYGSASGNFDINVSGLDSDWYTLSKTSVYLSAGQQEVIDLIISVPEACENSGTFPFQVSFTSQETAITRQGSANLIVEPTPVIHNLQPKEGASLGSDTVTFSWTTYSNATTKIYLKSEDETDYTTYTGAEGQRHTVVVSNLARNKNYSYYAESASPCGSFNSSIRTFYIGNGISFTEDVYEFTVERDYNQRVTIGVQNTDNEYHELLVRVPTTYDDLVLGFVGEGSQDNIIPLNPGESKDITLAVHLQDAMNADYELMANLTSTKGDEILTDTAQIKIHVHVPRIDYEIEEISVDEITLMKTFKLTNRGDPVTDLTISIADNLKDNAYIEPVIEHYRLDEEASVEFNVVPILSSPDFQPASPIPPVGGNINVNAAGIESRKTVQFTVPEGKQPYKATVSSPGVIYLGYVRTYHCNNNPNIKFPFTIPPEIKDKVRDDPLIIKFSSQGWEVKPHDIYISINGHEVGSLINTIPEGYYKFDVDPSFLIYPERGVAKNYIELHTVHQNGGHYLVSSDVEVRLNLENYETWVIASSQEEANQIAADNLPPGFYESPDSITIGEVEIVPEAGGSASLGATSTTPQVYISRPTTIRATAEPHLDVTATFSNGDGAVHLAEVPSGSGVYRGTWTPRNQGDTPTGTCVITIRAKGSGVKGEKTQTVKINEPTKLEVTILKPDDGITVSVGDAVIVSAYVAGTYDYVPAAVSANAARADGQGDDYGNPDSSQIRVKARFSNGDADLTLYGEGNIFTGLWTPKNSGDCTITVKAEENKGKLGSDTISVRVEEELNLKIIYPRESFEVLQYVQSKVPKYEIRVKVTDGEGKGVKGAQVSAEITPPNDCPTFYPGEGDGEYLADWYPRIIGKYPYTCKIEVTAEKTQDSDKSTVTESVTGTVDPEIEITDIGAEGVYHWTGERYKKLPSGYGLRHNTYDPLWDDYPINPSDNDWVFFTYTLNKDVDKVTITEYRDDWPFDEPIGKPYTYDAESFTSKGKHIHLVNVKDFDQDEYYIEVKARKKYEHQKYEDKGSEDCASNSLFIRRESFAQIYIEDVKDGGTGVISERELLAKWQNTQEWRNIGLLTANTIVALCSPPLIWVTVGYATAYLNYDDPDRLGCIKETWKNGKHRVLDRAEVVRFTGRVYEWDRGKYRSGYPEYDRCWLNGEFIYGNLYRAFYDTDGKPIYDEFLFFDHSPHDFLAKKADNKWDAAFYNRQEWNPRVPWTPFKFQKATFLHLDDFWGWSVPGKRFPPENRRVYSRIYFKRYFRWDGSRDLFESKIGDPNPFHGRDTSNPSLSEKNTKAFESTSGSAAFTDLYDDHGTDTDGDGLYNSLTLEVGLNVTTSGYYTIHGALTDSNGELIGMETKGAESTSGVQMLELDFNGKSIHQNEVNGTFSLMYIALYNENGDEMDYRSDFADGIYTTAAYNNTEFQEPTISFTDNYSEEIVDTDGDGSYDYLTINAEVNVSETGNYSIVGWLSCEDHRSVVQSADSSQLEKGLHEIQLSFDGTIIRQKRVDGPYSLNMAAYDESLHILGHRYDAYTTTAYHGSNFQRTAAEFNNAYSDQGTDTNTDGLYDYLTIDVGVNVTKAGNYTLSGLLVDSAGIFVGSADSEASLDVGTHTLHLNFDGQIIRQRGVDGAFNLSACLYNTDTLTKVGEMFNGYTTAAYSHMDFQAALAEFSGTYSDYGVDTNGDGLFDCLTLEVGIDVMAAGDYGVSGLLYDQNGAYVGSASNYLSLDNGTQTGQLDFDGQTIREHDLNGPYNLTGLTLYDKAGRQIDYQDIAYTTSAYSYTDFKTPFVEFNDVYSDYGTDTDGDGKYNYLVVEVGVTVATPGNYAISGTLNDYNGNHTVWTANHSFLDAGTQAVQLNFDGQTIRQHGVDGPYNLTYLEIYNADVRDIDRRDGVYTTSAYSYTDFETPSAQFNDILSDHGTDLDDDGLYDHLTVDVGVTVIEAGNYSLEGRLADNNGNFIVSVYNYTAGLDTGSQTIQLNFDGMAIRKHGMDSPYYVRNLRLCDESGTTIDYRSDAYITSAYNFTQFEGYPVDLTLIESDITFDPETPTDGETVIITATIRNTGTDNVSSVVVQFFDGDPDTGGVQIGTDQTITEIAHVSTGTAQVNWTAIAGTHDIFVRVDPYDSIEEAREDNNQAYKQITVSGVKTIYVDDEFTDDPVNHRWNTIQEGVNDANDGDTVLVYNGTYTENVILNKTLTLTSVEMPTIDTHGSGNAITITADNCTVRGFSCVNAHQSSYVGIRVESNNNAIEGNSYKNNSAGIYVLGSSNVIRNNIVKYNPYYGIILRASDDNIITNNTAKNNGGYGIYLTSSNTNRITDNDASNNDYHGIFLNSSNTNEIRNNRATTNHYQGIRLQTSDDNIITNNTAKSNGDNGIYLTSSNTNRITDNDASNNNHHGISLNSSNTNEILNNNATSNHYQGIGLWSSNGNIIANNTAKNNGERGIYLRDSMNNKIYLNNFMDNNNNNVYSAESINIWNSTSKMTYTFKGSTYTNYLGNYWADYTGSDGDNDGIGDTPYNINSDRDNYPLIEPRENYL